jgi:hypothetical protein
MSDMGVKMMNRFVRDHSHCADLSCTSCTHTVLTCPVLRVLTLTDLTCPVLRVLTVAAAAFRLLALFLLGSFLPLALKPCSHCGALRRAATACTRKPHGRFSCHTAQSGLHC